MPLSAFALALGAAVLHATWNVLLADSRDSEAATAMATLAGVVLLAPVALADGGVSDAALPFAGASSVLHVVYLALLARAYAGGQVSVVYPVSRGTAPVAVLVFGAIVLGEGSSAVQAAGVAGVSAGVFLVGARRPAEHVPLARRDLLRPRDRADDRRLHARRRRGRGPRPSAGLPLPVALSLRRGLRGGSGVGRPGAMRAEVRPRSLVIGACIVGAYGSVLAALRLADAAPVAAVRESSVVIATLFAAAFLHERVDARRLCGAVLVAAGVAAIALG